MSEHCVRVTIKISDAGMLNFDFYAFMNDKCNEFRYLRSHLTGMILTQAQIHVIGTPPNCSKHLRNYKKYYPWSQDYGKNSALLRLHNV